jgi:TRAP-type C4-dicarboxylate transport system permease small subunit
LEVIFLREEKWMDIVIMSVICACAMFATAFFCWLGWIWTFGR